VSRKLLARIFWQSVEPRRYSRPQVNSSSAMWRMTFSQISVSVTFNREVSDLLFHTVHCIGVVFDSGMELVKLCVDKEQ